MFDIEFWNMYDRTTQSSMRTNNSVEAYQRRIGSVFQCAHPTLWIFLEKLINEEGNTHADILQVYKSWSTSEKQEKKINILKYTY